MPLHKNQDILLTIDSLSSDGSGVGRHEGQAIFVPGAAPGDTLRVKIVKPAKSYAFARVAEVVTAGPGRIRPDCPIAGPCGGCALRHISYEAELAAKQGFVQDALQRLGKLDVPVQPILPSPDENRYRNKMQLPLVPDGKGGIQAGFYASRSHRVVPCEDCLLQPAALNEIAAYAVRLLAEMGVPAYDEAAHKGFARHLYLRQGYHSGEVMVCLVGTKAKLRHGGDWATALVTAYPQIATVVLNVNTAKTNVILGPENIPLYGPGYIRDTLAGVPLRLDPMSFAQVNTPAAEGLFAKAKEYAAVQPGDTLLDLYCGAGVIGLSMAAGCKQMIGVEVVPEAVENARAAAKEMGLTGTRFITADAGEAAAQLAAEGLRPDVVTVDPPRKGCDEATLAALVQMAPARIVMVSCNPATLARDLARLAAQGYTVREVTPADMFPRTKHVEAVALLARENSV